MPDDIQKGADAPDEELSLELAQRVRTEREYLGLSQEQVSRALNVSRAAVSAIETGRRKVSSVELARLAKLFGTTTDRLLGSAIAADDSATQLFRATKDLSDNDKEQVLRFAEFLSNSASSSAKSS
jgi:transcriptional regulator with XRE-family HTH domain